MTAAITPGPSISPGRDPEPGKYGIPSIGWRCFCRFPAGVSGIGGRAYPAENFGGQRWYHQYFAQDDIRVSDRLTVNLGLRYEYSPWMNGYKGQLGTFDPTQAKPIIIESSTDRWISPVNWWRRLLTNTSGNIFKPPVRQGCPIRSLIQTGNSSHRGSAFHGVLSATQRSFEADSVCFTSLKEPAAA